MDKQQKMEKLMQTLQAGDRIVLEKSCTGDMKRYEKTVLRIDNKNQSGYKYCSVTCMIDGNCKTLYYGYDGKVDIFRLSTRKETAEGLKRELMLLQKEVKKLEEEIDFYEKYESEEEYVASKIDKLMKTKGIKAKAEILKELRRSNLL